MVVVVKMPARVVVLIGAGATWWVEHRAVEMERGDGDVGAR